ncbi:MAG: hypothetical protein K2H60_16865 [Muribaculaceae bacterium]|nr:hypothetical protein [Muribaculaceae bacterium]
MKISREKELRNFMDKNPQKVKEMQIAAIRKLLDEIIDVILQWRRENPNACEADCISQCNLQMATSTVKSILSLAKGIHWGPHQTILIDTNACASLVRSLYERAFIYRNIFITTDNIEERDLLLYIWEIRGLNNRLNLKDVPEQFNANQENDRQEVFKLRKRLYEMVEKMDTTKSSREQISNAIKRDTAQIKGFKFIKEDGKIIKFENISLEDSTKYFFDDSSMRDTYTYLSLTSHPSYLGLLQFGIRYKNRNDESELIYIYLSLTYHLLSEITLDFCRATTNAQKFHDKLYPLTERYIKDNVQL